MAKLAADRYAEALFELAAEQGGIGDLAEQVKLAEQAFAANPEFLELLTHPKVTREEKHAVIENVFGGRFDERLTGLLAVIVDKGRCAEIPEVFALFLDKVCEHLKIGKASVTSATELTAAQKKRIEEKLLSQTEYESFEITYSVDPALIGGMVLRIRDRVVDASIKSKLSRMARNLSAIQLSGTN